jgi:hypothetical protein
VRRAGVGLSGRWGDASIWVVDGSGSTSLTRCPNGRFIAVVATVQTSAPNRDVEMSGYFRLDVVTHPMACADSQPQDLTSSRPVGHPTRISPGRRMLGVR